LAGINAVSFQHTPPGLLSGFGLLFRTNLLLSFKSVGSPSQRCIVRGGHDLFRKGISHKEIPLDFGVAKNSRSTPLNFQESPLNLLDLEF